MNHHQNCSRRKRLVLLLSFFAIASLAATDAQASGRYAPEGMTATIDGSSTGYMAGAGSGAPTLPYGATTMDQSAFAMGTMQWNVVFVENDGSVTTNPEFWSASEISGIKSKISEAATYWQGLTSSLNSACRLSINVNYVNGSSPVTVPYEPTADESEVWINSAMAKIGSYNNADRYTNVRNFNQDTRVAAGTNWSTTLFILDNTSYTNTSYAYSYLGGPFSILERNSAGWGPTGFNMVLAHEMGHIFFALDEYAGSGARTTDRSGYLNVANANASLDGNGNPVTPPQANALMLNNGNSGVNLFADGTYAPSPSARNAIGLRDTNGNGIPDILDTAPVTTGNNAGSNPGTGLFKFSGTVDVTALVNQNPVNMGFSNSGNAMTIDTVKSAYYILDGHAPVALSAQDGVFDGYEESIGFSLTGLALGPHSIDVYGANNVGNQSNTLHFSFNVVPEPSSFVLLAVGGLSLLVYGYRRKRRV